MAYYVRKIARSKWQEKQLSEDAAQAIEEVKSVKADAITNCIKTTGNKLSLWRVEEKSDSIDDIIPLIIGFERPDTCDVIYISDEVFSALELKKMIDDNTGRVFPGISLEAMVLVLSYVPKDRLLSLNIACSILNQEYGQYIAFNVLECQDRLILYGSVKCTAQSDEIDTVLIGTLNAVFQIVINIRRRMSNGVLIDFN